jgi:hypothetical protein
VVPKITTGSSIRSALDYDKASKNGEPEGEWIAGTLFGTPREMARQASVFRSLRPDCTKAIWSCSLSLPPADGRRSAENWEQIARSFLQKMGVDEKTHAWVAHRHTHENDHIHIRLCRVGGDGKLWNQEHSARRAIAACAALEVEFDLNAHDRTPAPKDRPSRAEIEIAQRKGTPMSRELIQDSVNSILQAHPQGIDFADLRKLLVAKGVDIQPYAPGGVLKGVSYFCDSFKWPGSKIGRAFSAGLTERGVRYSADPEKASNADSQPVQELASSGIHSPVSAPQRGINPDPADRYARAPAMLRPIFRRAAPANQLVPISAQALVQHSSPDGATSSTSFDMQKFTDRVGNLNIGPVSKAMLILGGAAVNLGVEALLALLNFVKKILAAFGIGIRPAPQSAASAPATLGHEPYFLEGETKVLPESALGQTQIEKAAEKILATAEAITNADPSSLPEVGDGTERAALVQALSQSGVGTAAAAQAAPSLNDIFGSAEIPVAPVAARQPAAVEPGDPIARLKSTAEAWVRIRKQFATARTQTASPELSGQLALASKAALVDYQRAQTQVHEVFALEIEAIQNEPSRKKLNANLKSALNLMRVIETPASMLQDLPAFIESGVSQLEEVRKAASAELALLRRQRFGHAQADSLYDAPRG